MTEDRFKNMTDIQWMIHYKMIEKEEFEEWKIRQELTKTIMEVSTRNVADIVEGSAKFLVRLIAPQNYKAYEDAVKEQKAKEGKQDPELVSMEELFKGLIENGDIPQSIAVDLPSSGPELLLPTKSRKKLGIQKE